MATLVADPVFRCDGGLEAQQAEGVAGSLRRL